jgi:spermidine/putrescine transport system permease protein
MGDYITATVLGGAKGSMIGQIVASQFQTAQNWALGSAMAVLLMILIMVTVAGFAVLLWLITMPMRRGNRLVLGPGEPGSATPSAPQPALEEVAV